MRLGLALLLIAATAEAQPRRNALSWYQPIHVRPPDANRIEVGAGASAGWRLLADVFVRCYPGDRWSVAARERLDLHGVRAEELELAVVAASRTLTAPGYLRLRAELVGDAGGGAENAGSLRGLGFAGARVRVQVRGIPVFAIELGARAAWVPLAAGARGLAVEVMASVAMSCPVDRRDCWPF